MRLLSCCLLLLVSLSNSSRAADDATYLLAAELAAGDTSTVKVNLEVGGDLIVNDDAGTKKLPLTVTGEFLYNEQIVAWSADPTAASRSLREYKTAEAKIQKEKAGAPRELPTAMRRIVAEIQDGHATFSGGDQPLTRNQLDFVNVVGNSLAINQLLPDREIAEGENWNHTDAAIGALLGMDHVAVCEVSSVVTGVDHNQVQIRLAGSVHGTKDGAPTEMELRGAYLFHQKQKRINKLNLAIKESRTISQVVPGLDIVAKISMVVAPAKTKELTGFTDSARDISQPLANVLRYEAPRRGFRFAHDPTWFITAEQSDPEQSDVISLCFQQKGNSVAHCNVTTLTARSAGNETTLEEFVADARESLGDNLETIHASSQWTTSQGHECLAVVALGKVKEVPIEWRYYLVASPGMPRVSVAVTIEQSASEAFDDADRQIIESMELLKIPTTSSAKKPTKRRSR